MPLIKGKSQKSFVKNLKTEMHEGKPMKQSLAIAYNMKRKAQKKAKGGMMHGEGCPCPKCCGGMAGYDEGGVASAQDSMRQAFHFSDGGSPLERIDSDDTGVKSAQSSMRQAFKTPEENDQPQAQATPEPEYPRLKNQHFSKGGGVYGVSSPEEILHEEVEPGFVPNHPQYKWIERPRNVLNVAANGEDGKKLNQHHVDMQASTDMGEEDMVDRIMNKKSMTYEGLDRMAEGGKVKGDRANNHSYNYDSEQGMEGVNRSFPRYDRERNRVTTGESYMGASVRRGDTEGAKKVAYSTIKEGRNVAGGKSKKPLEGLAFGGEAGDGSYIDDEDDLVNRIMHKRNEPFSDLDRYSEGGKVANQEHGKDNNELAGFSPNEFDDLVLRDDLSSTYGEDDNSGDALGNAQEDEDRKDIISRIMASRRKKDRLPNPA